MPVYIAISAAIMQVFLPCFGLVFGVEFRLQNGTRKRKFSGMFWRVQESGLVFFAEAL